MKIDTHPLEDRQIRIVVEATQSEFEIAKHKAAKTIAKRIKIPGFRPGKAPSQIALRHINPEMLLEETVDIFVDEFYPLALEEAKVDPYGPGILDKIASFDPPILEFIVPLKPEIVLGDYKTLRLPYSPGKVEENEVEATLINFQEQYGTLEPSEFPIENGDLAYVSIVGWLMTDENVKSTEIAHNDKLELIVADKAETQMEWPFRGFSQNLIGLSDKESKIIRYKFPDDYSVELLQGKQTEYEVNVLEHKKRSLPEITDEFAQTIGDYTDLESVKQAIREALIKQKQEEFNEKYDEELITQIQNISSIAYPPQMLDRETEIVIQQLADRLKHQKLDMDLYLKTRNISQETFQQEARRVADVRLKKYLLLLELSEAEKITVDPDELRSETTRAMDEVSRLVQNKKILKQTEEEIVNNLVGNIMMDMLIKQTMDKIRNIAAGKEITNDQTSDDNDPHPEMDSSISNID